jgi:hypothetical protein
MPGSFSPSLRQRWRRLRARRFLEFGKQMTLDFESPIGPVQVVATFVDEGETVEMRVTSIYSQAFLQSHGRDRPEPGIREVLKGLDTIGRLAAEAGFRRLRITGRRLGKERGERDIVVDLRRYERRPGAGR